MKKKRVIFRRHGRYQYRCRFCGELWSTHLSRERTLRRVCRKCWSGLDTPERIKVIMLDNMDVAWVSDQKLDSPCWLWLRNTDTNGYGRLYFRGRQTLLHRISAHLWLDFDLKSKLNVCHHCDIPQCINPHHLFIGEPGENIKDAGKKGRMPRGSRHHKAKLNENQVLEIRRRLVEGERVRLVAREFGVSVGQIYSIRDRRTWAWLKTDDFKGKAGPAIRLQIGA